MSRGKRILNLALNNKHEEKNIDFYTKENIYEFSEEDPWCHFKEWRQNRPKKLKEVDELDTTSSQYVELQNLNPKMFFNSNACGNTIENNLYSASESSTTENITSSSMSWKPSEHFDGDEKCDDDTDLTSVTSAGTLISVINTGRSFKETPIQEKDDTVLSQETKGIEDNLLVNEVILGKEKVANLEAAKKKNKANPTNKLVEVSHRKGRVWDKRDRCVYCQKDVTNFSRHLFRNHAKEDSVINILKTEKGSKERKQCINLLRKEGNFLIYFENKIRPVQRPSSNCNRDNIPENYLPCKYCKGLYKTESLRRHAKKCFFNTEKNKAIRYASEGQTILAFTESRRKFLSKLRLKTEVFHTMNADRISFNGKNDPIVCQYAEDYLRKHKRPHIKNLVSNKIRELGRLLIPLQDLYNINTMLEALKPENFDNVVSAAKIISGYEEETKNFKAPSLALHLRTIILAVCSAANTLLLKKDPVLPVTDYNQALKDLKMFRELVTSNWKYEMGSLALKDLNEKSCVKPKKIPLAKDIILFKQHCQEVATKAIQDLTANVENLESFKKISEVSLALTILLNRKRVGDVQYLKLTSYESPPVDVSDEEYLSMLSESEKELSKNFKRVITIGKGSRPVPILFPPKIQEYIKVMLQVRKSTTFVSKENPYLFALPQSSSQWINGSSTLRKFALACGAQHPDTLTSSRLRKQIATVLQILNLTDVEMEQIAKFMGHTRKTHEEFYRLPPELFQTAKIAKLFLIMEKGVTKECQGKTLKEIDTELAEMELCEPSTNERNEKDTVEDGVIEQNNCCEEVRINNNATTHDANISISEDKRIAITRKSEIRQSSRRQTWGSKQKKIMATYFKNNIEKRKALRKKECEDFLLKFRNEFPGVTWLRVKTFIFNEYTHTHKNKVNK